MSADICPPPGIIDAATLVPLSPEKRLKRIPSPEVVAAAAIRCPANGCRGDAGDVVLTSDGELLVIFPRGYTSLSGLSVVFREAHFTYFDRPGERAAFLARARHQGRQVRIRKLSPDGPEVGEVVFTHPEGRHGHDGPWCPRCYGKSRRYRNQEKRGNRQTAGRRERREPVADMRGPLSSRDMPALCSVLGAKQGPNEYWIRCPVCEAQRWIHVTEEAARVALAHVP